MVFSGVLVLMMLVGCSKNLDENLPKVLTNSVISLTDSSFECGGTVTDDGGYNVTSRGLCWSSTGEPKAVEGSKTSDGIGLGTFRSKIKDLLPETKYYYRAYATNSAGTSYGEERYFITKVSASIPTIQTSLVSSIELITAECGGSISANGGDIITRCGICWDTNPNPTTSSATKVVLTYTSDVFSCTMADLNYSTTYFVRAFAVNSKGVAYGETQTFKTKVMPAFEMSSIAGGSFQMGSSNGLSNEQPAHTVTLSNFKIGKTEVNVELWNAVMPNSQFRNEQNNLPISNVSFNTVKDFITRLALATKLNYRLPSEAEWEYAAGGGSGTRTVYATGLNDTVGINGRAWFSLNSNNAFHAVGTLLPNKLGLLDMGGNVSEWCNDWFGDYTGDASTNPKGSSSGTKKVYRGGSYSDGPESSKTTARFSLDPNSSQTNLGFRIALNE
jgi:formylglycine-generating enzyme required for sulfatase activity